MNLLQRTIYLLYYVKKLDKPKFFLFLNYAHKQSNKSKISILLDAIYCSYKYNVGLMDYFIFKFFEKESAERIKWVGTGLKYEYDLLMNPKKSRDILEDKIKFYQTYDKFVVHANCTIDDLEVKNEKAAKVLNNPTGKIVIKDSLGQCGWDVEVVKVSEFTLDNLLLHMKERKFNLLEEFIVQHPSLMALSPTGLNTVRVITQLNAKGEVDFLGARMRISVNSMVDNLASGNIACAIDLESGKISGKGYYSDITKEPVFAHPITKVNLVDYQIPFWSETLDLCKRAALHHPENKAIGWDVAITANGPEFIEANHNWCKILWQLPIQRGSRDVLKNYIEEFNFKLSI